MGLATQIAVCFFSFPPVSDFSASSTTFQAFFPPMLSSSKEEGKEEGKEGRKVFYVQKGETRLTWRRGGLEHELYSQISIISFTSNSKQSIASLQHRRNPGTTKPRKAVRYTHPH
jgi:hypothetical protein